MNYRWNAPARDMIYRGINNSIENFHNWSLAWEKHSIYCISSNLQLKPPPVKNWPGLPWQSLKNKPFYVNLSREDLHINNTLQPFPAKQTLFLKKCFGNEKHKVLRSVSDQLDNFNSLTWKSKSWGRARWMVFDLSWLDNCKFINN